MILQFHPRKEIVAKQEDDSKEKSPPTAPEVIRTDADTVKELVEMKFLSKKKNIRSRTPSVGVTNTEIFCKKL